MNSLMSALLSKKLWTVIYSAIPVTELRATIPLAITVWKIEPWLAFLLAVIGNTIPILLVIWGLDLVVRLTKQYFKPLNKFIEWVLQRTRRKTGAQLQKYGPIALYFFVAVPLPMTGAWTGSVAAWLFGIPVKKAFWAIFLGVITAGLIVTSLTMGTIFILK